MFHLSGMLKVTVTLKCKTLHQLQRKTEGVSKSIKCHSFSSFLISDFNLFLYQYNLLILYPNYVSHECLCRISLLYRKLALLCCLSICWQFSVVTQIWLAVKKRKEYTFFLTIWKSIIAWVF